MAQEPNRETPSDDRIRVSASDRDWDKIDGLLLKAASRIKKQVRSVVEQKLESTQFAEDILQSALLSVSQTIRRSPQDIDDLESYLFRSVLRELELFVTKMEPAEYFDPEILALLANDETWCQELEDDLFIKEFVKLIDPLPRQFYKLRTEGYKWQEIADLFQMSKHHAEVLYYEGVQRAIARLLKENPSLKLAMRNKA